MTGANETYGCLTFQASEPVVVGEVPKMMRMELKWLLEQHRRGIYVVADETVTFGRHEDGYLVWYNIIGWDPIQKALILQVDEVMLNVGA